MNNIFDKIYEAVNTGIQKALTISDNNDNDVSIKWNNKRMSTESNDIINYTYEQFISELLEGESKAFRKIINYYNNIGKKYKAHSLDELLTLFNICKDIKKFTLKWIDMYEYITIILDNNNEVDIYNFDADIMNPVFLKISNNDLKNKNSEVLIYIPDNHLISKNIKWSEKNIQIQDDKYLIKSSDKAEKDYSGYQTCMRISGSHKFECPSIEYCTGINDIPGYNGYLPSFGQLAIICDYMHLINYILIYIGAKPIISNFDICWSSTEFDIDTTWSFGMFAGEVYYNMPTKTSNGIALPVFTKK